MSALSTYMVPTQEEVNRQALKKQVGQLQKGDVVSGLGSQLSGLVVGVEKYEGTLYPEYKGTTTVVIKGDGPDFKQGIFPNETICLVECLA